MYHFNGSVVRALAHVYPDLDLQDSQFDKMSSKSALSFALYFVYLYCCLGNYWLSANNRRTFFDNIAKRKGFDPLVPSNWYSLKRGNVLNEKVCALKINCHSYDFLIINYLLGRNIFVDLLQGIDWSCLS